MTDSDYMNDTAETYKDIVKDRDAQRLLKYFFSSGRSGHAKVNAIGECLKQLWPEALDKLVEANRKDSIHSRMEEYLLRGITEAKTQIQILKEAVALIGSETHNAEAMYPLIVEGKTTVGTQLIIIDKCIEAGWAEPLSLLIERTNRVYHDKDTKAAKGLTYYSVHEKATEGLKTIASGLRALGEKGKFAEVARQRPATQPAVSPIPQARKRY